MATMSFGPERTTLRVGLAPFYWLFAKFAALSIGVGIVAGGVAAVVASGALIAVLRGHAHDPATVLSAVIGVVVAVLVVYLAAVSRSGRTPPPACRTWSGTTPRATT